MVRFALLAVAIYSPSLAAQLVFPLGEGSVYGRVYDSLTQQPILRTQICREYSVPIYGRALRCAEVDTLGYYSFDSLTAGPNTIYVDCSGRRWGQGRRLAYVTLDLAPGERRRLDISTQSEGCDPRPLLTRRGHFRGHFTSGFESSEFVPCESDEVFPRSDTTLVTARERRAWVTWPDEPVPGLPEAWPEPKRLKFAGWTYSQHYVEWFGKLQGPGHYGHMSGSGFQFRVDSISRVQTPTPSDCAKR